MTQLIEISSQIMLGTRLLELGTHRLTKGIGAIYMKESSTLVWNQELLTSKQFLLLLKRE
jgi:hypothetical protein